jgi:RNA polymerase sigma-70 factor (ECF subfamily)
MSPSSPELTRPRTYRPSNVPSSTASYPAPSRSLTTIDEVTPAKSSVTNTTRPTILPTFTEATTTEHHHVRDRERGPDARPFYVRKNVVNRGTPNCRFFRFQPNSLIGCGVSGVVATSGAHSPVVTADVPRQFDAFYRSEYPRLLRMLSSADLSADDALQEAFAKAALLWNRVSSYEDPAGWVRHVAVRRMLDERRSAGRKRAAIERLNALSNPEDVDRDGVMDLAVAIDGLPTQQRVALSLFYLGGLTSAQTGDAMGISAGAVRFHLHEARATLRERLEVRDD